MAAPLAEESRRYRGLGRICFPAGSRLITDYLHREIFRHDEYLQHGIELRPGDTVFDVGANIGLFALRAAQACAGDLTLYAFEPMPDTFRFLRRNLALHGLDALPSVHLINAGLGAAGGPAQLSFTVFARSPALAAARLDHLAHDQAVVRRRLFEPRVLFAEVRRRAGPLFPLHWLWLAVVYPFAAPVLRRIFNQAYADATQVACAMTSFTETVRRHRPARIDLLKIDVEGAELEILRSIEAADWALVRQAVVEVHDFGGALEDAVALLRAVGFDRIAVTRPPLSDVFKYSGRMVYARRGAAAAAAPSVLEEKAPARRAK